jgi:Ca-activated chloride channel family protein
LHLLNPAGWWFAAIIPIIIIMYLLKPRYQEQLISSTYLWEQALRDIEASQPWQRLKRNLLLFLQLLAAAFLVLALTRPYFPVAGGVESHVIAVLDSSGSMRATDVSPTRFDEACRQVEKLINELGPRDEMTLIGMGTRTEVLAARSRNRGELRRALNQVQVGAGNADLEAVLSLVSSLTREEDNALLVIFSDGHTIPVKSKIQLACPVELRRIGRGDDNTAIMTLAVRGEGARTVTMARIKNYSSQPVETGLELLADENLVDVRELKLKAGAARDVFWEELPAGTEVVQARLTRPDSLNLDNQAWAVVEKSDESKVLLVSEGNIFMEKALALIPGVKVFKTTPDSFNVEMGGYQAYVFDGWLPKELPAQNMLVINPPPGNPLVKVGEEHGIIEQMTAVGEDPLLKYVELEGWQLARSRPINCPNWARPLLEHEKTPLLVAGEYANRRVAVLGFDLHDTNIPLQTGFPILINNLGAWLLPEPTDAAVLESSGDFIRLAPRTETKEIILTHPGGEEQRFEPPFPAVLPVAESGVYCIAWCMEEEQVVSRVAKNPGDNLESDIKPRSLPWSGMVASSGEGSRRATNREIWPWLLGLALLTLVGEWEVYRRGY